MFLTKLRGRGVCNMVSHTHAHTILKKIHHRDHRLSLSGENGMMVLFQNSALIQPLFFHSFQSLQTHLLIPSLKEDTTLTPMVTRERC